MKRYELWDRVPYWDENVTNDENAGCPSVDAYLIEDGKIHPCFVICPGGGYTHRADHEGGNIAQALNKLGISAFVLNYRVAPYTHPVELTDAKRAMRFARYNAKRFNIDPSKIGIMGFSAGAHLACTVAEHYDNFECRVDNLDEVSARPDLLCLCYPVVTMGKAISHQGSCENLLGDRVEAVEECIEDLSCEDNIREDMPPVFIWHTFEDASVDCRNSLVMATKLKEHNIKCELHLFPDGRHGLDLAEEVEGTNQWFGLFTNWLKRYDF